MSSFWKWFLIVTAVLVVLGVIILVPGLFFLGHTRFGMVSPFRSMPMMHSFGFFSLGGMFIRLLVPAVGVGLLILLGVVIGKSSKQSPVPAVEVKQGIPVVAQPAGDAGKVCSQCGSEIEDNCSHCPYCGCKI